MSVKFENRDALMEAIRADQVWIGAKLGDYTTPKFVKVKPWSMFQTGLELSFLEESLPRIPSVYSGKIYLGQELTGRFEGLIVSPPRGVQGWIKWVIHIENSDTDIVSFNDFLFKPQYAEFYASASFDESDLLEEERKNSSKVEEWLSCIKSYFLR